MKTLQNHNFKYLLTTEKYQNVTLLKILITLTKI